jgi:hypothetical protein
MLLDAAALHRAIVTALASFGIVEQVVELVRQNIRSMVLPPSQTRLRRQASQSDLAKELAYRFIIVLRAM